MALGRDLRNAQAARGFTAIAPQPRPARSFVPPTKRTNASQQEGRSSVPTNADIMATLANARARREQKAQQGVEEANQPLWGRGISAVFNNPVTRGVLKPFEYLDYGRRAVTLGVEELAEGLGGRELSTQVDPVTGELTDTRSNWDKLNDPTYGVGQLLPDVSFDDSLGNIFDKGVGFVGDVAFDPTSYVGGIGIASKVGGAGGRVARGNAMGRVLNAARREGTEITPEFLEKLQDVGQRGFAAASPEMLEKGGLRGGIRVTSNPLSPYSKNAWTGTIPGSEKVTKPLSLLRTTISDKVAQTNTGTKLQGLRVPKGQEKAWARMFRGQGDDTLETAIDDFVEYQAGRKYQGAFALPLMAQADRLAHESRKLSPENKASIVRQLESGNIDPKGRAVKYRQLLDQAWRAATGKEGGNLPLAYRKKYSPHIPSRQGMEWRRDPTNGGRIKAPEGFFTEARYDPSGVTMGRKLQVGDEFEINGVPIKLETATIEEVNRKFRQAGLNFDFFETDPGIIMQKYINMLSDDVGSWNAAKELASSSANKAKIQMPAVAADFGGLPVERAGYRYLESGGDQLLDGDAGRLAEMMGVDPDALGAYNVRLVPEATKELNKGVVKQAKKAAAATRAELKARRNNLDTQLRAIAAGDVRGGADMPSLNQVIAERAEVVDDLGQRARALNTAFNEASEEVDVLTNRYIMLDDSAKDVGDEIAAIDLNLEAMEGEAVKSFAAGLRTQRRKLVATRDKLVETQNTLKRGIEARSQYIENFDDMIQTRRQALYEQAGVEAPESGLLPGARTAADVDTAPAGGQAYPQGRMVGELEARVANAIEQGGDYQEALTRLAEVTGRSEKDLLASIKAKGVKPARGWKPEARRGKLSSSPEAIESIRATAQQVRQQQIDDANAEFARLFGSEEVRVARPGRSQQQQAVADTLKVTNEEGELVDTVASQLVPDPSVPSAKESSGDWFRPESALWKNRPQSRRWYIDKGYIAPTDEGTSLASLAEDVRVNTNNTDLTDYQVIETYFDTIDRKITAENPNVLSDDIVKMTAQQLGIEDVEGVRLALTNKAKFAKHVKDRAAKDLDSVVEQFDALDPEVRAGALQVLRDDPDNAAEFINDLLTDASGVRTDYGETVNAVNPKRLTEYLEAGQKETPAPADIPVPRTETPDSLRPSPEEYEATSRLRRQAQELEGVDTELFRLRQRAMQKEQDLQEFLEGWPWQDRDQLDQKIRELRQALVNEAQESTDPAESKRLLEASDRIKNADEFYLIQDRLGSEIATAKQRIKTIEAETPARRSQIDELAGQIGERETDMASRVPGTVVHERDMGPDVARRTAAAKLEQVPSADTGSNLPNLGSGTRRLERASGAVARGKEKWFIDDGVERATLASDVRIADKVIAGKRTRLEKLQTLFDNHPRWAQFRTEVKRASGQGGITKGKVDLPPRPTKDPANVSPKGVRRYSKRTYNVTPEEIAWAETVDRIMAETPIRGSYPARRGPQGHNINIKEIQLRRELEDEIGITAARAELEQALEDQAALRSQLDRRVMVGDDPESTRQLSAEVRGLADPGERARLQQLEASKPQIVDTVSERNLASQEKIGQAAGRQLAADVQIDDVSEQLAEIIRNGEAREAIRREAMNEPLPVKMKGQRDKLQSEYNVSVAGAAQAEARLPIVEQQMVETRQGLKDIAAEQMDAARLAGEAKGTLARVQKLKPTKKNRGNQNVEDFLSNILEADPDLKDVSNQATVFAINKAEEMAEGMQPLLEKLEAGKLANHSDRLGRAVEFTLDDQWDLMYPMIGGMNGPIIHKDLQRMRQNVVQASKDSKFWKAIDNLTGLFKTYAVLTPGFHVRNAMSGTFMNASDGIPTTDMAAATAFMYRMGRAVKENRLDDFLKSQEKVVLNKETGATMRDALDAASGTGIGGRYREHGVADRTLARHKVNERLYENWLTLNVGKRPGGFVEASLRMPGAIDTLRKGGTVDDAVERITRLHFDYSEVSKFDESMRRVIPFWTFMSRNMPLQVSQMWTNPRAYGKYQSFIRNLKGDEEPNTPDYFGEIGAFRLGESELGGLPLYLQPDLAHTRLEEDWEKYTNFENPARMLSDFNPLFTAAAEYGFGKDIYTGRQFEDTDVRKAGLVEKPVEILARLMGTAEQTPNGDWAVPEKLFNAFRAIIPVYDRSVRLAPGPITGGQDQNAGSRTLESWGRLAGLPIRQLSPEQQRAQARADYYEGRDVQAMQRVLAELDQ